MSNVTAIQAHAGNLSSLDEPTMLALVTGGDCSRLTPAQKTAYYVARCEAAGLDPRAQPFAYVRLNGKEVLYAQKACSDQLAAKHKIKTEILSQTTEDGVRIVTVRVTAADGRQTEEIGALTIKGLQGEALANALMKCVTKAKRRAILSVCGLGAMDETEVETIPGAQPVAAPVVEVLPAAGKVEAPPPAAAQAVEAKPAKAAPPVYVLALWNEVRAFMKETKSKDPRLTRDAFESAGRAIFGETPKPSAEWTPEETAKVREHILGPDDIQF